LAEVGGTYGGGVIFVWDPAANTCSKKHDFDGTNGASPEFTALIEYMVQDVWTWTGAINSDWANGGNWNTGVIPNSSSNVSIPDVTNDPVIDSGTLAESNELSIEPGVVLTIHPGGTLTANGTIIVHALPLTQKLSSDRGIPLCH